MGESAGASSISKKLSLLFLYTLYTGRSRQNLTICSATQYNVSQNAYLLIVAVHHITAYKGQQHRPAFKNAILQSPGFFPQQDIDRPDETYAEFLSLAGAKNLHELAKKDSSVLMEANANMTWESLYGYYQFGPTLEGYGGYVPDFPGKLLKDGKFHQGIPMMLGYLKLDGLLFTPPWIRTQQELSNHVQGLFPNMSNDALRYVANKYQIKPLTLAREKITAVSDFFNVSNPVAPTCGV
jgi:carboxylesterase type B